MNRSLPLLLATAMLVTTAIAAAQDARTIPMRDFFRNPERAFFRISSDGKTLSFMQPWERRMNIYVQPVGSTSEPVRITSEKDRDIAELLLEGSEPRRLPQGRRRRRERPCRRRGQARRGAEGRDAVPRRQGADRRRARRIPEPHARRPQSAQQGGLRRLRAGPRHRRADARRREPGQHHVVGRRPRGQDPLRGRHRRRQQHVSVPRQRRGGVQAGADHDVPRLVRAAVLHRGQQEALCGIEPRPRQGRDRAGRPRHRQGREDGRTSATTSTSRASRGRSTASARTT